MKNSRSAATHARRLAAAVSLLAAVTSAAASLQGPGGAGPPPEPDLKREMRERQYSEARLRGSGVEADVARLDEQRIRVGVEQTKSDFKRIQLIRNEMVDALLAQKPLDYKLVSNQAEEINKRAGRLKSYLMQPVPDDKKKEPKSQDEFTERQMKEELVKLCNLIYSFTQNPVLKNLNTTDVQQSARAGGDLLSIIEISSRIQKSAEKLKKTVR
jgi:hypothetical protein